MLVINKPAGLPTMGVPEGQPSLLDYAKQYIKEKYDKPGKVYLGIVSRLDAPVTGAVLIARTSKAAARLSLQFRERTIEKSYLAIVENVPPKPQDTLTHWLKKDERHRRMHITQDIAAAQEARLRYEVLQALKNNHALIRVKLETGRKHQIRVQLSAIGCPIIGDRKYKSTILKFEPGIALHSQRVVFQHPTKRDAITVEAPQPDSWKKWLR